MTNVSLFRFKDHDVRTVEIEGEPWFLASDVCRVLKLSNSTVSVGPLTDDEKSKADLGLPGKKPLGLKIVPALPVAVLLTDAVRGGYSDATSTSEIIDYYFQPKAGMLAVPAALSDGFLSLDRFGAERQRPDCIYRG